MPWCPVCKNEYVDGIKICADCKVELIEELESIEGKAVSFGTREEMESLNDFLQYNQVMSGKLEYREEEQIYELLVDREEGKQAVKLTSIFTQEEALRQQKNAKEEDVEKSADATVYENKSDKAENFKTSAYTLFLVGALGILALLFSALQIIPFQFTILTYVVMGILFILFIIMGYLSFASYKKLSKDAVLENNLAKEIKSWCSEKLTADRIDQGLFEKEIAEEMKYFKRTEQMKKLISDTYINLEEGFLDVLVEEIYPDIFE